MAEFIHVGGSSFDAASVTHATFDGAGGAKLYLVSGAVIEVASEDADAVAKAVGRHDALHLTAKEAKADEKAAEAAAKAAEPVEPAKAHGTHHK